MIPNDFQWFSMGPTGTGTAPSVVPWSLEPTADELDIIIFLHFTIGREAKRYQHNGRCIIHASRTIHVISHFSSEITIE